MSDWQPIERDRRAVARQLFSGWSDECVEKPLDEFVAWLRQEAAELGGSPSVRLEYESGSYDSGDRCTLSLVRLETDAEMRKRQEEEAAREAQYRAECEARERATYVALRSKFEDGAQ